MKNIKHILVPVDGSDISTTVLETAITLANRFMADKLILVEVVEPLYVSAPPAGGVYNAELDKASVEEAEGALRQLQTKYQSEFANIDTMVLRGDPGKVITSGLPDTLVDLDLIVMGATGKGMIERMLVGSVANYVVSHGDIDTYLVR